MSTVLLATFQLMPDGEPGGDLIAPLAARGIEATWAVWDDPDVDWGAADLVVVRSTWDYSRRWEEFRAWIHRVQAVTPLINPAELIEWNADKAYLCRLSEHLPVVPTELLDDGSLVPTLRAALERWGEVVIKPRTGAGGVGVVTVQALDDPHLSLLPPAPWLVQPLLEGVRRLGERSVFVFDGTPVAQVDKVPAAGELRVHEKYGGSSVQAAIEPELAELATQAVTAAAEVTGMAPAYARADLMPCRDGWALSELELIEPGLYLDVALANAERFADMVARAIQNLRNA